MLKLSLIFSLLMSLNVMANNVVTNCRIDFRPTGIWYNQCPRSMIAQGVDVWNPGPSPYPQVRVLCAELQVVCQNKVKKDLHIQKN